MAVAVVAKGGMGLAGPAFTGDGRLLCCGSQDGTVYLEDSNTLLPFATTSGCPTGVVVDHLGTVYILDQAHCAVLVTREAGPQAIISEYSGKQLLGPNNGVFDSAGQLYFTDSGPFGETSLERPKGSLFAVSGEGNNRILRPLLHEALAAPSGLALSGDEACLYVAETGANRLLRGIQRPAGVWHFSPFFTFNGKLGPTAVVADAGRSLLYVARADLKEVSTTGVISVLTPEGELLKDIPLTGYPELSGMVLTPDGAALILTEASTNAVIRVQL